MSPVGDAYSKKGLAPGRDRVAMCEAAAAAAPLVMVDAWEARQQGYTRTLAVLRHVQQELRQHCLAEVGGNCYWGGGGGPGAAGGCRGCTTCSRGCASTAWKRLEASVFHEPPQPCCLTPAPRLPHIPLLQGPAAAAAATMWCRRTSLHRLDLTLITFLHSYSGLGNRKGNRRAYLCHITLSMPLPQGPASAAVFSMWCRRTIASIAPT